MSLVKKKKIAFVANCCIVGGVETALINLLNVFDTEKYDVTLYTNFAGNPVIGRIPDNIRCIDLDEYNIKRVYNKAMDRHDYFTALKLIKNYALFRVTKDFYNKTAWLYRHISFNDEHYDCVILYKYGISTIALAKKSFTTSKKAVWAHGDMPYFSNNYLNVICTFDHCFCVSEYIREYFLQHCPSMKEKTEIFHNILNANEIIKKAQEPVAEIGICGKTTIVTVGRLGQDKGQIVIPETASLLKKSGIDFTWYIVGDGPVRDDIEQEIQKRHMENNICLLGTKESPYPYMNACSIYVQTSTSEGWCLTTQEARILHKPCVVTDIPVMHEQFTDGVNGIISKGTDAAALYDGIMRLLSSQELRERIVNNLKAEPQDGAVEMQKLYDFLES